MKAPLHIEFPPSLYGQMKVHHSCPADFIYQLRFAKAVHLSCKTGEFILQSVDGSDYRLELWWFSVKERGHVELIATAPVITVVLFLKGNPEGDLHRYGKVYLYEKTFTVFYLPSGKHILHLKEDDYLLLYFIPPFNLFEGMQVEHVAVKELTGFYLQKKERCSFLAECPLPKDVWLNLKRIETISANLFALDLPLRRFMIELLSHYSGEMRRHASNMPVYSTTKGKAVALRDYLLANLSDSELGTLHELAKRFYITIKPLAKEFKLLTGLTISQFILEQRLERAKQLLAETRSPLIDIAITTGFTDASHFIKKFKQKYGYTPRRYKEH